jgi:hypothetical protein
MIETVERKVVFSAAAKQGCLLMVNQRLKSVDHQNSNVTHSLPILDEDNRYCYFCGMSNEIHTVMREIDSDIQERAKPR